MLVENSSYDREEESDDKPTDGSLPNQNTQHSGAGVGARPGMDHSADIDLQQLTTGSNHKILNFFRGSVTSDRLRHESDAQHGGLAHWRHNTSQQRDYDDQALHGGMGQPLQHNKTTVASSAAYEAANRSPGMGLEAENFQSFITGSNHKIIAIEQPKLVSNEPTVQEEITPVKAVSSVTRTDNPLIAPAGGEIYNYRRKKSVTFTNLLARAKTIFKA